MSPLNGGECPKVTKVDGLFFCQDYENRPNECVTHSFSSNVCPIGKSVLNLKTDEEVMHVIAIANQIIREGRFF